MDFHFQLEANRVICHHTHRLKKKVLASLSFRDELFLKEGEGGKKLELISAPPTTEQKKILSRTVKNKAFPTDVAFKIGSQIMCEKVAIGKTL